MTTPTPERENLDAATRASVERGLAQSAAGQTVDLGSFTRDIVDLSQVTWRASYVEPGTPYPDEDTEMIPVGWYVMGEPSWDEETPFVLHLDYAYDEDGFDVTAPVAERIARVLSAHSLACSLASAPDTRPESRRGRLAEFFAALRHGRS